jgi:iron(III) transport system permease protein
VEAVTLRTFRKVVLPLMRPGLTAGWVFVFVLMAGDVTMSVLLASTSTPVVGFVMVDLFQNGTYPLLAAMGVIITVVSGAVVVGMLTLSRASTPGFRPQ